MASFSTYSAFSVFGSKSKSKPYYSSPNEDEYVLELHSQSESDSGIDAAARKLSSGVYFDTKYRSGPEVEKKKKSKSKVHIDYTHRGSAKRKNQRWRNDNFVESDIELDIEDYKELFAVKNTSVFSLLFTNEHKARKWAEFRAKTEEQQKELLERMQSISARSNPKDPDSPAIRFSRIEKKLRVSLRRQYDNPFLKLLEDELLAFIMGSEENLTQQETAKQINSESADTKPISSTIESTDYFNVEKNAATSSRRQRDNLVLTFQDKFHRLLAHGICQYYNLQSYSIDKPSGERITIINKPCAPVNLPHALLSSYLTDMAKINNAPKLSNTKSTFPKEDIYWSNTTSAN